LFGLDAFEWWAFCLCLAPALDLRYERVYGFLQDDVTRTAASADLILHLLLDDDLARLAYLPCFGPQSPLRANRLLLAVDEGSRSPNLLRQTFQAAPEVVAWLLGSDPAGWVGAGAQLIPAPADQPAKASGILNLPPPAVFERVRPFLSLYGEDLLQQEWTVRQYAAALPQPLLKVSLGDGPPPAGDAGDRLTAILDRLHSAVRDARLLGALLYVQGGDGLVDRDGCLHPPVFESLRRLGSGLFISSRQPVKFNEEMPGSDYPLMQVSFQPLTAGERRDLWAGMLGSLAGDLPAAELDGLAGQFVLTSGQIVAAASTAMSQALLAGRPLQVDDLNKAACLHSGHHLAELAQKIEPRFTWSDLVLPATPLHMLHEMVNMIKSRRKVMEEWGLGSKLTASGGVAALFTGPPGTGKTLAAQVIANELGIDLYRIDLSTVISKYVGETEKNLERIFREAQTSNAILFFDEADAIFGKRSEVKDAQDRYANIEVGYLLQRMEGYSGIAILATNLRANLDEAFTRRLQFIVTFPFPDEADRLRLWDVLMPAQLPRDPNLDMSLLARRFKLAGGNIRNIIVSAAYLAAENGGQVTMSHLIHGTRREFQKMGKLLHEADFVLS
jgi:hypothetical protein